MIMITVMAVLLLRMLLMMMVLLMTVIMMIMVLMMNMMVVIHCVDWFLLHILSALMRTKTTIVAA